MTPMNTTTPKIPTPEEIAAAQAAVDVLEAEWDSLEHEERTIRSRLRAIEARRVQINDWRNVGALPRAQRRLAEAQQLVRDSTAPTVRVSAGRKADINDSRDWQVCVIDANGPKRAVVRERFRDMPTYQLPSKHYIVHPDDRHLLKIFGA